MPKISKSEQIILGCGTSGFDRDIFGDSLSLHHFIDTYVQTLSKKKQCFLDNEVQTLCGMLNDHEMSHNKNYSKEAWD